MSAPKKTLAQYLQWAALKPRTSEWSALVAYDKGKCNQLLLQEYIEKHDKHSVMPPINEAYSPGETDWSWLIDYVTDAPRLSFDNNPDPNSAEVNMKMAIMGGKNIKLDDVAGFAQVNRISSFDPLDHPELSADRVLLKDIQGSVTRDGKVVLDLGDAGSQRYIWEVKGDRIEHQRRMAGAFFKRKFREADEERRTFTLGTLARTTQEFMKPQSFKLRTIMEEGAAARGAANFGNGAVEMRIRMDDELEGGMPGEDWYYPLPSDRTDLDTLTIFGSRFLMHGIIGKGTARAFNAPNAEFEGETNTNGFTYRIKVKEGTQGALEVPRFTATVGGGRRIDYYGYLIPIFINAENLLTMTFYDSTMGEPHFEVGMGSEQNLTQMKCYFNSAERVFNMGFGFSATYAFSIDPTSRRLVVTLQDREGYLKVITEGTEDFPEDLKNDMTSERFKWEILGHAADATLKVFNGLDEIDIFLLHTLLFNAEDAVQLKTLDLPGEMILFGSINPRLTTFAIDPVEIMLTHGQNHTFKTVPPITGVKWRVEDLDGNTPGAGQMNETTGVYTAPSLADIQGTYKRVKVIATGPGNGPHISRALVTVVARAITLNPLIEICNASKENETETRQLSAHSMDGVLGWSVIGGGSIDPTANENGENIYRAPLRKAPGAPTFTLDEVVVENTATGQKQSSFMVVKHFSQVLSVTLEYQGLPANQAKLIAKRNGVPISAGLTWSCMPEDAGSIDSVTGVFTASQTTNSQFVLIKARQYSVDFGIDDDGFSIQPLPLAPLPPKPQKEDSQTSAFDELKNLLSEASEKLEELCLDPTTREKANELLDNVTSIVEDTQNDQ
ncbi:hypothetical protein HU715_015780 [Pseudomonas sp. SWRI12]|uniref:Uncharacterized protein n=1 Tax=Pseudomonas zanjanensis TaxID=2745496 RepID=A0A923FIC3_9PSED|nr:MULTISPECIES: hypothetical protein [Pseudomonas]MBC3383553.1 hypothetical protein [Pseudomonas sp. SWRI179]MBV4496813.1 hypothetical protein [Pseudomonas zanjanensis]